MKLFFSLFLVLFTFSSFSSTIDKGKDLNQKPSNFKNPDYVFGPTLEAPFSTLDESFEDVTFPPAGWIKASPDGGTGWNRQAAGTTPIPGWTGGTVTTPTGGGIGTAFCTWNTGGATSNDQWLITPQLTNVQANDSLSFWMRKFGAYLDVVDIKISTTTATPAAMTIAVATLNFSAADSGWVFYSYNIGSLVSAGANIYIGFQEHVADNTNDGAAIFLDLVKVTSGSGPVGPGAATNPNPLNGATGISINLAQASWTNPSGAVTNSFYFGTSPGSLALLQSGTLATSYTIPPATLMYNTTYYWRVDEIDGTGTTTGPVWSFVTELDPNIVALFSDDFSGGASLWTITNNGGNVDWQVAPITRPGTTQYTLPATAGGNVLTADIDQFGVSGQTLLSTAQVTAPINAAMYQTVELEFDNDFRMLVASDESYVEVSTDGTTWTSVWTKIGVSVRNTHEVVNISSQVALSNFYLRFRSVQPGWHWWWVVDNVVVKGSNPIPVELTSFIASANGNDVTLNWSTATETNNKGFEVQRKVAGGEFNSIAFIQGKGTTTQTQNYSYSDIGLTPGAYSFRLKQVDFDGTTEYSEVVEVEISAPAAFELAQNYPNPFNPSTAINFSLAVDSKVSLKVFNILGQEVTTLLSKIMNAGSHKVNFDASSLNSGVYLYKIEAQGIDGTNFSSIKKMVLTK